jgi:hypothetical protein
VLSARRTERLSYSQTLGTAGRLDADSNRPPQTDLGRCSKCPVRGSTRSTALVPLQPAVTISVTLGSLPCSSPRPCVSLLSRLDKSNSPQNILRLPTRCNLMLSRTPCMLHVYDARTHGPEMHDDAHIRVATPHTRSSHSLLGHHRPHKINCTTQYAVSRLQTTPYFPNDMCVHPLTAKCSTRNQL